MMYDYKLKFSYRKVENGEQYIERLLIRSKEKDPINAGEIEMLRYLSKHGYYSGKVIFCERY